MICHHPHWCQPSMRSTYGDPDSGLRGWRYGWGSRRRRGGGKVRVSWQEFYCWWSGCVSRGGATRKRYPREVSCGVALVASDVTV